jgi:cobalt/nickel transport system permease protein
MHIPDGYLGPPTYGVLWAATAAIWYRASVNVKKTLKASEIPLLALSASFSFVVMMFNIPIPGGTTGHATGATLIAVLIGPWAAALSVSIALVIQALIFGDGGITAIGANCFNIAIAETLAGYALYRVLSKGNASSKRRLFAAGAGAYIGINTAAFLTAVELGIQTVLHVAPDGRPLYGPFPLAITVPAIMAEHIVLFGFIEAVVTVLALAYIERSHPELLKAKK